jgi:hypothetical protein
MNRGRNPGEQIRRGRRSPIARGSEGINGVAQIRTCPDGRSRRRDRGRVRGRSGRRLAFRGLLSRPGVIPGAVLTPTRPLHMPAAAVILAANR